MGSTLGSTTALCSAVKRGSLAYLTLLAAVLMGACRPTKDLAFQVFARDAFGYGEAAEEALPGMFVIAAADEIGPRFAGYELTASTLQLVKAVDYEASFLVFILVGQIRDNGNVAGVRREDGSVSIQLQSYSIGPGNYELPSYTMPYEIVQIAKEGKWGREIDFTAQVLSGEGKGMIWETQHFIP